MIETLLDECLARGYSVSLHLASDARPSRHRWEARVTRALPEQTPDGYVSATGSWSAPTAELALDRALDLCENDFERLEPTQFETFNASIEPRSTQPASVDIGALLHNLRPPVAAVFRRRI